MSTEHAADRRSSANACYVLRLRTWPWQKSTRHTLKSVNTDTSDVGCNAKLRVIIDDVLIEDWKDDTTFFGKPCLWIRLETGEEWHVSGADQVKILNLAGLRTIQQVQDELISHFCGA